MRTVSRFQANMGDLVGDTGILFARIQAPKTKSISRKAIEDFLADRDAYEDLVAAQPGILSASLDHFSQNYIWSR